MAPASILRAVRWLHTVVWAFFAGLIVAIPVVAWQRRVPLFLGLAGLVMVEVLVLAANRMRCPLTAVAARYTDDRRDNFDIYLPLVIARYNKEIFGSLYVAGLLLGLVRWLT
jgi:hypothetical protein